MIPVVRVIPAVAMPRDRGIFDYRYAPSTPLQPGSIVHVGFRGRQVLGVVVELGQSDLAPQRLKDALPTAVEPWSQTQLDLLLWFADYYAVSPATALKVFLLPQLTRPRQVVWPQFAPWQRSAAVHAYPALEQLVFGRQHLLSATYRVDMIMAYRQIIDQIAGLTAAIVVPEYSDVAAVAAYLAPGTVYACTQAPSASQLVNLERRLAANQESVVVVAPRGTILPLLRYFSTIIVDQAEAKAHKQFDHNPRYHLNTVVDQWWQRCLTPPTVIYSSVAPGIILNTKSIQEKWPRLSLASPAHLDCIDMNREAAAGNYSWFSEYAIDQITASQRVLLLLNRTGDFSIGVCRDCGALLSVAAIDCPTCHGTSIKQARRGTQSLERELTQLFPKRLVTRVDRDVIAESLPSQVDIVVGTEKALRVYDPTQFDCIGVLSVDHLLLYPHFAASERVYQFVARVVATGVPTFLQTHAPEHPVITALERLDYDQWYQAEIAMRQVLQLPPFAPFLRLIDPKTGQVRHSVIEPAVDALAPGVIIDRWE